MDYQSKYNNIQLLRFLAALSVVLYHGGVYFKNVGLGTASLSAFFSNSFFSFGVTLFFVISGFVLSHTLRKPIGPIAFLKKRLVRIYLPFLLSVILFVLIKLYLFKSYDWDSFFLKLVLLPIGPIDYPLGVEWTLVYEVVFYILFSIVLLCQAEKWLVWLAILWFAIIFTVTLYVRSYTLFAPKGMEILLSEFNYGFILGILVYHIHKRISLILAVGSIASGVLLLGWIYFGLISAYLLLILSFACALIILGVSRISLTYDMDRNAFLVKAGDASYGIYLMHVPIITILLAKYSTSLTIPTNLLYLLIVSIALVIGYWYGIIEYKLYHYSKNYSLLKNSFKKLRERKTK